jgi:hypothetical protein
MSPEIERCDTIEEWLFIGNEFNNEEILLVTRLKQKGFTDQQILDILHVIDNTCRICLDGDYDCKCAKND